MAKFFSILVLTTLMPLSEALGEESPSKMPLWVQAIEITRRAEGMCAAKVLTEIKVHDGDEKFLGSMESIDVISPRPSGSPAWVNVSKKTSGSPGFTMELNLHIEKAPAGILDGYSSWTKRGSDLFSGKSVELWEGVIAEKPDNRILAKIDPTSGQPCEVELQLPIRSSFGTRSVKITVLYGAGPGDTWVPLSAKIDQAGRVMLWRRHLIVTKIYQDWARLPKS